MCPERFPVLCNVCNTNTSFILMKTHSDSQGDSEEDGEKKESQKMRNYLVKNLLDSEMSYFECIDMIRKVCWYFTVFLIHRNIVQLGPFFLSMYEVCNTELPTALRTRYHTLLQERS